MSLVHKVNSIMIERDELLALIFEYVTSNELEESFHKHLQAAEESDEYKVLDLEFMALDYQGYENKANTIKGDNKMMGKDNAQKLIDFMDENEGMDEAINESIEHVVAQRTTALAEENERLTKKLNVFEFYLAASDNIQGFINLVETHKDEGEHGEIEQELIDYFKAEFKVLYGHEAI